MAEDVASIGVKMETEDVSRGIRTLDQLIGMGPKVEQSMGKLDSGARKAGQGLNSIDGKRTASDLNQAALSADRLNAALTAISAGGSLVSVRAIGSAAKDLFTDLYAASAQLERFKIGLNFASGGNGASELSYLRGVTRDLGLEFSSTAKAYVGFQASAKGTSLDGERARTIFESISKASAVMGLSAEQSGGALLSLQQMISKGTVQAEELRGQLGERLPGAFQIAARSMGVTTAELGKMLEQGQVIASDFLPKFAEELNKSLGDAAENAANRLDAATNRYASAMDRMKSSLGDSGISQFWAGQMNILTDAMDDVSNSMLRAKQEGDGFAGQMVAAAGAAARFINPLNAVSYSAQDAGLKLKEAEKNLADLEARGAQRSSNLMLREAYAHAQRLVDKLREAKKAQDALAGGVYTEGMGNNTFITRQREDVAASEKEMQSFRMRAQGINQQYFTDIQALQKAKERGVLSEDAYVREMSGLATRTYENSTTGKDAKKGERDAKSAARLAERLDAASSLKSIAAIKAVYEDLSSAYSGSEAVMEAARRTGLLSEREYYDAKIAFVNLNINAKKRELEEENKVLEARQATGVKDIERDKKIEENKAKINRLTQDGAFKTQVLTMEATAAINAQASALDTAKRAAADYLATLQRGFDRDVMAAVWGSEHRNIESGRQQIEDRYLQQRVELENQRAKAEFDANGKLNADQRKFYDDRLAIINEYESKALASYTDGVSRRLAAEGDWLNGVNRAWEDYTYGAANVAQQTADLFSNAFKCMEDSLVTFVTTGKLSFTGLANSIVTDITRIIVKQQLSNALGVAGTGGSSGSGLMGLIGAGLGMLGGSSAVATAASALPGDSLDNFLALKGLATGGYTGDGGKYEPAGIVHRGEYVINAESTKRIGLGLLSRLNGYADGGYVDALRGSIPSAQASPASVGQSSGRGGDTYINLTVQMPQGATRETAMQLGRTVGRQIAVAQSRNG